MIRSTAYIAAALAAASACGTVTEKDSDAAPAILDDAGNPIACRLDRDCGLPEPGPFGECDYEDTCDEEARRIRMVATPRCEDDVCILEMVTEIEDCERNQNGATCQDDGQMCGNELRCHTCQSGACQLNAIDYDASCNPDCDETGRLCATGIGICCIEMQAVCPGASGTSFDCSECCFQICDFTPI